jgi:hypothetical protein
VELLSKVAFGAGAGCLIWVLHRWIGSYPPPLPRSSQPARAARNALLLWLMAFAVETVRAGPA